MTSKRCAKRKDGGGSKSAMARATRSKATTFRTRLPRRGTAPARRCDELQTKPESGLCPESRGPAAPPRDRPHDATRAGADRARAEGETQERSPMPGRWSSGSIRKRFVMVVPEAREKLWDAGDLRARHAALSSGRNLARPCFYRPVYSSVAAAVVAEQRLGGMLDRSGRSVRRPAASALAWPRPWRSARSCSISASRSPSSAVSTGASMPAALAALATRASSSRWLSEARA